LAFSYSNTYKNPTPTYQGYTGLGSSNLFMAPKGKQPTYAFAATNANAAQSSSSYNNAYPPNSPAAYGQRPSSPYAELSRSSSPVSQSSPTLGPRSLQAQGSTPLLGYAGMSNSGAGHLQPSQQQPQAQALGGGYLSRSSSGESNSSAAGMLKGGQANRRYGPTVGGSIPRGSSPVQNGAVRANSDLSSVNSRGGYAKSGAAAAVGPLAYSKGDMIPGSPGSLAPSISDKFSLSADPKSWGADVSPAYAEADDYLHNPDPKRDRKNDHGGSIFTWRGLANIGTIIVLVTALIVLFAGWPIIAAATTKTQTNLGAYNLGGINSTGQVAATIGNFGLIDQDTPQDAYYHTSYETGEQWELIFSDEFNADGRTFYPGDDPFWEAEDIHYWVTNNLEWYEPRRLTTKGGNLVITLDKYPSHNLNYEGGLMT